MPALLVIDDDPAILLVFRRAFAESDVALRTAATAREGLEAVARDRPDVALVNVRLPDMEGLDLYRAIRHLDGTLPVIFITAGGTSDTMIEAMKLGAFDYLTKRDSSPISTTGRMVWKCHATTSPRGNPARARPDRVVAGGLDRGRLGSAPISRLSRPMALPCGKTSVEISEESRNCRIFRRFAASGYWRGAARINATKHT
jgi:CheY-like chemotaxis protein